LCFLCFLCQSVFQWGTSLALLWILNLLCFSGIVIFYGLCFYIFLFWASYGTVLRVLRRLLNDLHELFSLKDYKKYLRVGVKNSFQDWFILKFWKLENEALEVVKGALELQKDLTCVIAISSCVIRKVQRIQNHKVWFKETTHQLIERPSDNNILILKSLPIIINWYP